MSAQLKKEWCFIQLLTETNPTQQIALLKTLTDRQLAVICEIVLNTLKGYLYIPASAVEILKRHKTFLRYLTTKDGSQSKKKKQIRVKHQVIINLLQSVKPLLHSFVAP